MTEQELNALNVLEDKTRNEILGDYINNLLIEALAGAGKTTILVDRLKAQVKTTDPSKIVAITFTEKAADELKGRFQEKLLEEYNEATGAEKDALQNAVEHINDIQISTIHAFCNKLLKEMAFEAGLGLDFEVVQDVNEEEVIRTFFENFCRDDAQREDRERLAKAGINAEQLFSTFKAMCYKKNVDEWVYDDALSLDSNEFDRTINFIKSKDILKTIYDCLREDKPIKDKKGNIKKIVQGFTDEELETLGSRGGSDEVLKEPARRLARHVSRNGSNIDLAAISIIKSIKAQGKTSVQSKICTSRNSSSKNFDESMLEKSKESYKSIDEANLADVIDEVIERWDNYLHAICMHLLVEAYDAYQTERIDGGKISNDELLIKTRDMLKNSKKARDFFRSEYQYFYIDEYQDTDPVQTEILTLLTATESTIGKTLEEVDFLDDRFCLIGDPKQSIYAFRGADVRLYARMRAVIEAKTNCKLYQMNRNYRSNAEICEWVNKKFIKENDTDFGFESCGDAAKSGSSQAGFDGMISAQKATDTSKFVKGVYKYNIEDGNKDNVIAADAKHVAYLIKNMIDSGVKLSIMDTKTGIANEKSVEAGDFMVLTRKKDGIRNYATELKALGIPVLVNGASLISLGNGEDDLGSPLKGFRQLKLLSDFVAERNPSEGVYKLALILVKVFGIKVSPVEVFTQKDAIYGEEAEKNLAAISDVKLKNALTLLVDIKKLSKSNPLLAFEKLAESYSVLLDEKNSHENIVSEVGALEQILEQIRDKKYGSYKELDDQLQLILRGKNEKELPMGEEESKKAVHIMNAHLAKGLESNIVILACPAYGAPGLQDKVIVEEVIDATGNKLNRGYVSITLDPIYANANRFSKGTAGSSQGFDLAAGPVQKLQDEENLRILYVSGTRPKECLIIADTSKRAIWSDLTQGVADINVDVQETPEYQKMIVIGVDYKKPEATTEITKSSEGEKSGMLSVDSLTEDYTKDNVSKACKIESLKTVSEITIHPSELEQHSGTDNVVKGYMYGNLYGTMMHKFFELLIMAEWSKGLSTVFSDEELEEFARKAVAAGLESEKLTPMQCERLKVDSKLALEDISKQQEELTKHMIPELSILGKAILADAKFQDDLKAAKNIETEMPFELNLDASGIAAISADIKGGYRVGQEIHVRGTMDLLLELEDSFIIWDYKSDLMRMGENKTTFEARLKKDYAPQLRVYEVALSNITAADASRSSKKIETKIYHRFR